MDKSKQIRIMPVGDSITVGYTDNPEWQHPFEFGYRSGLYKRLNEAGYDFVFVGESKEPFDKLYGDPTHEGSVTPEFDLREVGQGAHNGYGCWNIKKVHEKITGWIKKDKPDIILLLIGINCIDPESPKRLEALIKTIYEADKNVKIVVGQITPMSTFKQDQVNYNTYIRETLVPEYSAKNYSIRTVDLYKYFLTDSSDPKSIDIKRLSNELNHPTNQCYDQMAESWFQGIKELYD